MYAEWISLSPIIQENSNGAQSQSVLNKFSGPAGREVAVAIVKQLAGSLGLTQPIESTSLTKTLQNDEEILWCMNVICYGLSLPLNEHETIKDCVNVYCEWLSALNPQPRSTVPKPICEDPNMYAAKIINHFHNLFVPRSGEGVDTINRQAVLCHRVLRTLQLVAQTSTILTRQTWDSLLLFLIAINEILLSPPMVKDDVGDQLCERVLSVLFEVWLLACGKCFPSPSLWKTLQESCALLRHRIGLIEQWNRVNLALTARLLEFMYGSAFPELKILDEDAQLIPSTMTNDCVAQTWYRFLRIIGSPIVLCSPQIISKTPQFMQWTLTRTDGAEPFHHPCLLMLPQIFLKAIKGVASQMDAFLGIYQGCNIVDEPTALTLDSAGMTMNSSRLSGSEFKASIRSGIGSSEQLLLNSGGGSGGGGIGIGSGISSSYSGSSGYHSGCITPIISTSSSAGVVEIPHSPTPPLQRRLAKSFSVAPSSSTQIKGLNKSSLIGLTSSRSSSVSHPASTPNSGPPSSISLSSLPSLCQENRPPLAPARPKCNSILHLFGEWLFEAALVGGEAWIQHTKKEATEASRRPSSMIMDNRKGSLSLSQPTSLNDAADLPNGLTIDKYESGRAEAIGALCRLFCAKKTGEEILPVYLARFYTALQQGLKIPDGREVEETLASILHNSSDLFRLDLDGLQVLLPAFIGALELVLPEKELKMKSTTMINKTELRRASIHILISILPLPLHFQSLPIRDFSHSAMDKTVTFAQLKSRLINILMNAVQVENDPHNTHMLLGGLLLCVQDSALYEDIENPTETYAASPVPSDMNLLSSDNAHALFVRATYLVCHRLISSWKTDLNVSLAALELLSGLARMHIKDCDALECKRAVKWICDYICYQCSRPPPAHSKDLHSTIVAAFQCTSAWLMQHPYLLQDKDCLTTVLEVVELGISGSKSIGKPGEPIRLKDDKELKPASMRVRDAAEMLLTIILEQVGYFPSECGPQSSSSLLDEVTLYKHCNTTPEIKNGIGSVTQELAIQKFKYFVTENSTILALLEEPLGNDQDPLPTVTLLIRGPFGRHAWTMQLRHLPRSKSGTKYHAPNPGRPVPMNDMPIRHDVEQKFFPEGVDRIPPCIADYSIPTLDSIIQKIGNDSTKQLFQLLEGQTVYEKMAWAETDRSVDSLGHAQEAVPPPACHEFQAARLFLSHFGFLSIDNESKKDVNGITPPPLLTVLDTQRPGFCADLQQLDKLSSRTHDTLHIFYVKCGQTSATDIIENMSDEMVTTLDQHFWNILLSLGWPVDVDEHAGWSGCLNTSWKIKSSGMSSVTAIQLDELKFNGEKRILYWADVGAEIAFVVPTKWNRSDDSSDGSCLSISSSCSSDSEKSQQTISALHDKTSSAVRQSAPCGGNGSSCSNTSNSSTSTINSSSSSSNNSKSSIGQKPRTLSLELDKSKVLGQTNTMPSVSSAPIDPVAPTRRRTGTMKPAHLGQVGAKILLVWLESFEDHLTFPLNELLAYTKTGEEFNTGSMPRPSDSHIIFLHSLNSGLLRVKLQGPSGRMSFATPLIDGMVVSKRVVGNLVRQTVYNMARRRRLDNDLYQPPHVRRRIKILDMANKYNLVLSEPELLSHLFKTSS